MQCCNKHVIIYSGARVSEFIRAIRSFISIDLNHNIIKKNLIYFTTKIWEPGSPYGIRTVQFIFLQDSNLYLHVHYKHDVYTLVADWAKQVIRM